jgi:hypothetical protein
MRGIALIAAMMGLLALTPLSALAAPLGVHADLHAAPAQSMVTNVDYWWHHQHWHHRHWHHGHWRYWD